MLALSWMEHVENWNWTAIWAFHALVLGAVLSTGSSFLVNRRALTKTHRLRIHLDLIDPFLADTAKATRLLETPDEAVELAPLVDGAQAIWREAVVASKADERHGAALLDAARAAVEANPYERGDASRIAPDAARSDTLVAVQVLDSEARDYRRFLADKAR